jgi:hypothetical protein
MTSWQSARSVHTYIARAVGDRLLEVQFAREMPPTFPPLEELNLVGCRLKKHFLPDVPDGAPARSSRHPIWAAKGWRHWAYPEVGNPGNAGRIAKSRSSPSI